MEWVLQLVDEIDDAIGAARHRWMGFSAQFNVLLVGMGALVAGAAMSALRLRFPRLRARS